MGEQRLYFAAQVFVAGTSILREARQFVASMLNAAWKTSSTLCQRSSGGISCSATHLAQKPRPGQPPITNDRVLRNAENAGCLPNAQAREEAQFDDLRFPCISSSQGDERVVHG